MMLPLLLTLVAARQDSNMLSVNAAVAAALRSHPSIAVARAREDRAAANAASARSALLPRLRLDASVTEYQEPNIVYPLHSLDFRNPPVFDQTLIQPGASASWLLYDFGARRATLRAAQASRDAAVVGTGAAGQDVIARTVSAYLGVLAAREISAADRDEVSAVQAELDRARRFFAVGKSAQVDVLRAQAELQRAVAGAEADAAQLDVAERTLAEVTGLAYVAVHASRVDSLRLADSAIAADTSEATRSALVRRALVGNAESEAARRNLAAATATAAAARAMRWPTLQAGAAYLSPGSINGNFHPDWQVGVSMSYAIYSGGATGSAIDAADAGLRGAEADVRLAALGTEAEVDQALAAIRQAAARVTALHEAATASAEVVRIEALSRDVGEGTQTDYLTAAADLLRTRASLIAARQSELNARVDLARLTGDLSADWIARNLEPLP